MRIYVSHSATVASAPELGRDPEKAARGQLSGGWFVVEPLRNPEFEAKQVESLLAGGRTVIALDVEPNRGLGVMDGVDYRPARTDRIRRELHA